MKYSFSFCSCWFPEICNVRSLVPLGLWLFSQQDVHSSVYFYGPVVSHLANFNLQVHFWEACSFLLNLPFCWLWPSPEDQNARAEQSHRACSSTLTAVFPGEAVTPGGPSRLKHHGLWLFYSRDEVRRKRSLWHKLCSRKYLSRSLKTWI